MAVFRPADERFWEKVNKDGPVPKHRPELGQCWIWTAYRFPNGYGRFDLGREHIKGAHVASYILNIGPTNGFDVLHACDNKACIRPSHLFLGTDKDNMDDAKVKKIILARPDDEIREIRRLYEEDHLTYRELAQKFNSTVYQIGRIIRRERYKDVA